MSAYEYWTGRGIDIGQVWRDYEEGEGYERKFLERSCHLLEIEFEIRAGYPVFAFEAIFKTTKRYFHDLKKACLTRSEDEQAARSISMGSNVDQLSGGGLESFVSSSSSARLWPTRKLSDRHSITWRGSWPYSTNILVPT